MAKKIVLSTLGFLLLLTLSARAENYTVTGDMTSGISYELQHQITTGDDVRKLILSFVLPQDFQSPTYRQVVKDADLAFSPEPQEKNRHKDSRGNDMSSPPGIKPRQPSQPV